MIGLYGGTCNNMYVFAKSLAQKGIDIKFIEDRKDNFPHSQPVWEDVECYFESGFDYQSIDWDEFEREYGWKKPDWYYSPNETDGGSHQIFKKSPINFLEKLLATRFLRSRRDSLSVFNQMLLCDCLIVCGIEPALLARLSGKPYMLFPHGSDMRVAIGAQKKGVGVKGKIVEWLTVQSFRKAFCVGSPLPDASAEVPDSEYRRLKNLRIERVALPYASQNRLPRQERFQKLNDIFELFGISLPEAQHYAFSPSRINFHWKGHDKLLKVICEHRNKLNIHFIFLGWGDDYREALRYVHDNSLQSHVTIIPVFLSKGFLYKFFESVDFIVDQFNGSGSYGASLSEAMSRGCPIMTWISDMFDKPGWERPPVIQAQTNSEISAKLLEISSGDIDLDLVSEATVNWFKRVHDQEFVVSLIVEKFGRFLN